MRFKSSWRVLKSFTDLWYERNWGKRVEISFGIFIGTFGINSGIFMSSGRYFDQKPPVYRRWPGLQCPARASIAAPRARVDARTEPSFVWDDDQRKRTRGLGSGALWADRRPLAAQLHRRCLSRAFPGNRKAGSMSAAWISQVIPGTNRTPIMSSRYYTTGFP